MRLSRFLAVASLGLMVTAGCLSGGDNGTKGDGGGDGGTIDPSAPTCAITAPADGTSLPFDENFTFVADASDLEDGALSGASVVWRTSQDNSPLGTDLSLTTPLVPGVHTITCTTTDSDGKTGSATITVTSYSPVARLNHPGDEDTRPAAGIPFAGSGNDYEDGALTGGSLVWTSDLDGEFGTGETFDSPLTAGTNTVTLTVTDSDGNTDAMSITLTVTP